MARQRTPVKRALATGRSVRYWQSLVNRPKEKYIDAFFLQPPPSLAFQGSLPGMVTSGVDLEITYQTTMMLKHGFIGGRRGYHRNPATLPSSCRVAYDPRRLSRPDLTPTGSQVLIPYNVYRNNASKRPGVLFSAKRAYSGENIPSL